MAEKREVEVMRCAYCNRVKAWRDGFPSRGLAQCWECVVKSHLEAEHRPRNKRRRWWWR